MKQQKEGVFVGTQQQTELLSELTRISREVGNGYACMYACVKLEKMKNLVKKKT